MPEENSRDSNTDGVAVRRRIIGLGRPEMVCLYLDANVGFYSLKSAELVGRPLFRLDWRLTGFDPDWAAYHLQAWRLGNVYAQEARL